MGNQNSQSAPPYLALAVISAAGLAYEVLLTRLFSIVQWHHFAYMIISLALLGFGASGTVLAFTAGRWQRRFYPVFAGNALLFSVSSVACFAAAQALPFNPLELFWDPVQPGWLILIYLLLSLPFFFVANCMGLSLFAFPRDIPRIYAWDLVGAGVGALGMVVLLYLIAPGKALLVVAALGMTGAFLTLVPLRCEPGWRLAILAMAAGVWVFPAGWEMPLRLSPFKGLSQALQVTGAGVSQERSSPLGLLSVVENRRIPFRYAPGLSLTARGSPPPQKALFTDADSVTAITRFTGDTLPLEYLDYMPSALPYHLTDRPRVLILGAGGGMGLLQAIYHRAKHIDAVELNPQVADLLRVDYADFAGGIYQRDDVTLHLAEARSYVEQAMGNYGVVQVSLVDSFSASSGGVYALNVSYLYTEEAIRKYLGLLEPDGFLAITRWTKLPPRDGLKLFATVLAALEGSGVSRPEERLAWIRSWNTSTLVISRERLSPAAIVALRRFCAERSFDPIYFPGIVTTEVNRFNRLDDASFHHGAV
ncbi:MAG: SAM-dependent methyltransferase, partial [Gammaproteobacteria bacterium]|nr:SAM-dependent methyltransferase [Gammaproteobacteria bacterium]